MVESSELKRMRDIALELQNEIYAMYEHPTFIAAYVEYRKLSQHKGNEPILFSEWIKWEQDTE